jgi:hypothetical protein
MVSLAWTYDEMAANHPAIVDFIDQEQARPGVRKSTAPSAIGGHESLPTTIEIVDGRSNVLASVFEALGKLARCVTHCHA